MCACPSVKTDPNLDTLFIKTIIYTKIKLSNENQIILWQLILLILVTKLFSMDCFTKNDSNLELEIVVTDDAGGIYAKTADLRLYVALFDSIKIEKSGGKIFQSFDYCLPFLLRYKVFLMKLLISIMTIMDSHITFIRIKIIDQLKVVKGYISLTLISKGFALVHNLFNLAVAVYDFIC